MISCLIQLVLNSPVVIHIVKDVLFTGIYRALSYFWLFKIHHDSQIKIFTHNLYKTESNKVVCSLEQGFLLSVKWSLHTYRTCSSHCFLLSWWCLQTTCMYQCRKLYNCLIFFTNRCAPCTATELCVATLSGILACVRKNK